MPEISKIVSVDLSSIRIRPKRSEVGTRVAALDIGQGFEVSGMERDQLTPYAGRLNKEGRRISIKRLGPMHFLIFRYA